MRIFGWTSGKVGGGGLRYRLTVPFAEAAHQGLATWDYGARFALAMASDYDVVLVQGAADHTVANAWDEIQAQPEAPVLVFDHDDDYFSLRPSDLNPGFGSYERFVEHNLPAVERILRSSDLVTVSVPHLAEQYRQHTDKPVVVLPNTIDGVLLDVPQRRREPGEQLRVGWSGSPSHEIDWRQEAPGIAHGLRKTGARLVLMGYDPRHIVKHPDNEHHPWKRNLDEYYLVLTTYHVAICPLIDDLFNRSKSPVKALEASALGIPVIASAARPYQDFVIHGETGFLVRREHEWASALRALANDEDMRYEMGANARRHASYFATANRAGDWIEAYQQAHEHKHGHRIPPIGSQLVGAGAPGGVS
jgi:glycosyltransferase involved in cell wall biosynthesis